MSQPVEISNLASVINRYGFAYLLTASAHGAPHAVAVSPQWQDGALLIDGVGRRTRENAARQNAVGLVWPPRSEAEYSLIVDGTATATESGLRVAPTRAVLHRSAPSPTPKAGGGCQSDCVELGLGG